MVVALQPLDFLLGVELDSDLKVTQVAPAHLTLASQVEPIGRPPSGPGCKVWGDSSRAHPLPLSALTVSP